MKIKILKRKKSWEPFRICLLNSTAFQPNFGENGLDWLCYFFFLFNIFIYFLIYETIETHARAFLTLNILSIGTVMFSANRQFHKLAFARKKTQKPYLVYKKIRLNVGRQNFFLFKLWIKKVKDWMDLVKNHKNSNPVDKGGFFRKCDEKRIALSEKSHL